MTFLDQLRMLVLDPPEADVAEHRLHGRGVRPPPVRRVIVQLGSG